MELRKFQQEFVKAAFAPGVDTAALRPRSGSKGAAPLGLQNPGKLERTPRWRTLQSVGPGSFGS